MTGVRAKKGEKIDNPLEKYSVGKVARMVEVETHTIRFWQKNFPHIKYTEGQGKRKYYDKGAIEQFKEIKRLMYVKGLKIFGIKQMVYRSKISDKRSPDSDMLAVREADIANQGSLFLATSATQIAEKDQSLDALVVGKKHNGEHILPMNTDTSVSTDGQWNHHKTTDHNNSTMVYRTLLGKEVPYTDIDNSHEEVFMADNISTSDDGDSHIMSLFQFTQTSSESSSIKNHDASIAEHQFAINAKQISDDAHVRLRMRILQHVDDLEKILEI